MAVRSMPEHTLATGAIHHRLEELASLPVPDAEAPWQALRASLPDRDAVPNRPVELASVRAARRHRRTVRRALALAAALLLIAGSAFAASRTGLFDEIRRHLGGAPQGARHDVPVSGPTTGHDRSGVGGGIDDEAGTGTAGQGVGGSGTAAGGDGQTAGDGDADDQGGTTSTGNDEVEDQDGDSQGSDAQSGEGDEQGPGDQGSGSQDGGGDPEGSGSGGDHSGPGGGSSSDTDSQG